MARPRLTFRLLVSVVVVAGSFLSAPHSTAQPAVQSSAVAFLFLVDRVSFEEVMADPVISRLASTGGAGLLTTGGVDPRSDPISGYEPLGAGSMRSDRDPGLLAASLSREGIASCGLGTGSSVGIEFDPVAMLAPGPAEGGVPGCGAASVDRAATGFPGGLRTDPDRVAAVVASLAASPNGAAPRALFVILLGDTLRVDSDAPYAIPEAIGVARGRALLRAGAAMRQVVESLAGDTRTLVVVATPAPSFDMHRSGDETPPVLVAEGPAGDLFVPATGPRAVTSDSTRLDGVVASVDVAPTILDFFAVSIPTAMSGRPVRVTDAPPPFDLHRRHLEQRRVRFPVQIASLTFVLLVAVLALGLLGVARVRGTVPLRPAGVARFLLLCALSLHLSLLVGGGLPRFTYAVVVPFLVASTLAVAWLALRSGRRRGPLGPFVFLGATALGFVLLDSLLGGGAFRMPLLGGTALDGVRFYGLPNVFLSLVLAGALFLAVRLASFPGFVLLAATGLFVGFPGLGADVGGSVTLFAAAGLWRALRTRGRIGVREIATVAGVTILGLAVVLLGHRLFPGAPTHAAAFVEEAGREGFGALWDTITRRLGVGWRQVVDQPAVLLALITLPLCLVAAVRPGPVLRRGFALEARWRHVVMVLTAAAMVAYVANDTGAAAAGACVIYAIPAVAYPTLLAAARRGGDPEAAAR